MPGSMNIISSVAALVPESGGPSRSTSALCHALACAGVGVGLMSLDFGNRLGAPLIPPPPVETELVPCRFFRRLRLVWAPQFERALSVRAQKTCARLIHDNGLWMMTNHAAARVARRSGLPFILSTRGMLAPWAICHKSWKKRLAWRLYQAADLRSARVLHATSAQEAQAIRQAGVSQPIAIIPNGVDVPPPGDPQRLDCRTKTALFVGRIHPVKGLEHLVAAWAPIRPQGWQMVIAGPGEDGHRVQLEKAIRGAQLDHVFSFVGPVADQRKADLYRDADLFILPSFTENFGLAIAEALAHGVPVITTKGTPWREMELRQCGWWIDPPA